MRSSSAVASSFHFPFFRTNFCLLCFFSWLGIPFTCFSLSSFHIMLTFLYHRSFTTCWPFIFLTWGYRRINLFCFCYDHSLLIHVRVKKGLFRSYPVEDLSLYICTWRSLSFHHHHYFLSQVIWSLLMIQRNVFISVFAALSICR